MKPELRGHLDARMGWFIIIGSLPIVVLGVLLKDVIERDFRNLWLIATTLVVMGIVLGIADRMSADRLTIKNISLRDAVLMGLAQALALIPGVSRSGATISMGRALGYQREAATRYAFLLAIPAVVGAGLFELKEIPHGDNNYGWGPTIVATVVAFLVGYAAIAWLLRYVSSNSYTPFVIYRVALGLTTMVLLAHRRAERLRPLEPAGLLEEGVEAEHRTRHQREGERVAEASSRARACARSSCRRRRRSGWARPRSRHPAEILRMSSFCCTEIRARCASKAVDSSESRVSIVSAVRLRWSETSRKNGAASASIPLTEPRREPAHRLPQREHGAAYLGDLALEGVDAHGVIGALGREDRRLDLVDVDLELRRDLLVAVDDRVAHGVDHRGRAVLQHLLAALEARSRVVETAAVAVPDGHDEVVADEHVDLAGLDGVLGIDVPEGLQGEEQAVVVAFELRALVSRHGVLDGERVQAEHVGHLVELGGVGLVQADPDEVARLGRLVGEVGEVVDAAVDRDAHPAAVEGAVDDHPVRLVAAEQ